jgi:putative aldouronate transport system substrate-binding protein
MKKLKSVVSNILCAVMALSCVSCSGSKTSSSQSAESDALSEKMEISFAFFQDGDAFPTSDSVDAVTKKIEDKLNITVKPYTVTWSDYSEKYNLWAASNSLPDITAYDAGANTWKWQSQGIIRSIPSDLSAYPYIKKIMDNSQTKLFYKDGKYWCIPRGSWSSDNQYSNTILVNKKIYDSLGLASTPKTMVDYISMFEAIKKKYPDITPLTTHNLGYAFSFVYAYNPAFDAWTKENNQWIPGFFSNSTLTGIKAMKKLWDDGLLDKDVVANSNTFNGEDKFIGGKAAAIVRTPYIGHLTDYATKWYTKYGTNFTDNVVMLPMPCSPDGNYYQSEQLMFWSESYFSSKVSDAKMARILSLYNYLESPEGSDLRWYGIEGKDYTKSGDTYTITRKKDTSGNYSSLTDLYKSETVWQSLCSWDEDTQWTNTSYDSKLSKFCNSWLTWKKANVKKPSNCNILLGNLYTPLKSKFTYNTDSADMITLLMSKDPDATWAKLMSGYKAKGLDAMVSEVNKTGKEDGLIS